MVQRVKRTQKYTYRTINGVRYKYKVVHRKGKKPYGMFVEKNPI